jgi:hypothetical protein
MTRIATLRSLQDNSISIDALQKIIGDLKNHQIRNLSFNCRVADLRDVTRAHNGHAPDTVSISYVKNVELEDGLHKMDATLTVYFTRRSEVYRLVAYGSISGEFDSGYMGYTFILQDYLYYFMTKTIENNRAMQEFREIHFPDSLEELEAKTPNWNLFEQRAYSTGIASDLRIVDFGTEKEDYAEQVMRESGVLLHENDVIPVIKDK